MGERAKIIINEYTALEILHRPDFDINRFYSSDYRIFIIALLKENKKLKNLCNKYEKEHSTEFKIWKDERQQLRDYKSRNEKAIEYVNTHKPSDTISFPLMKKNIETQVKRSFDYEFREIYQKELLNILQGKKYNEVERAYLDDKPIGSDKE